MRNIALLVISLAFCIAFAELVLSPFWQFEPRPRYDIGDYESTPDGHFVTDEKIGWRMKPKTRFFWKLDGAKTMYEGNYSGFRSPDYDENDARKTIVLLGDSYTFGTFVNYEKTFGAVLDKGNPNLAIQNLAMPGFGVDQMLMTLKHYALDLSPDLLIVGLVDSDFERSLSAYRPKEKRSKPIYKLESGNLELKTVNDKTNPIIKFLDVHSRLYAGFKLVVRYLDYHYSVGPWWPINGAIIDDIHKISSENGAGVLFVYLPSREWRPFPMLEKYMAEKGYNFINIQTQEVERPLSLYLENDRHFNAFGHKFVAAKLQEYIETHSELIK